MWSREEDNKIAIAKVGVRGIGILDTLYVCILVGLLIGFLWPYHREIVRKAKETTLRADLVSIRKAIELHDAIEGEYPVSLSRFARKKFVIETRGDTLFSREYLNALKIDPQGYLLDPFSNRYRYDPQTGHVASITRGYESW